MTVSGVDMTLVGATNGQLVSTILFTEYLTVSWNCTELLNWNFGQYIGDHRGKSLMVVL